MNVIYIFQHVVMWTCFAVLVLCSSVLILAGFGKSIGRARRRLRNASFVLGVCAGVALIYGGRKGTVTVSDPYIVNAGSYLTNDVAHVSLAKRSQLLPDSTEILVYARQVDQTNATDWVRLEPHLTFADHPYDYALVNATNYDVMVAANFTPEPTIHTNGVLQIKGFTIPGTNRSAFPNTKVKVKEVP